MRDVSNMTLLSTVLASFISACAAAAQPVPAPAAAQQPAPPQPSSTAAPMPTSQSPLQRPPTNEGIPPCPTFAEQRDALATPTTSGTEKAAAQPGERSGVLPNAVGPGTDVSAAPTVQTDGESVRSPIDCPLVTGHPNALDPGPKIVPELSKPN